MATEQRALHFSEGKLPLQLVAPQWLEWLAEVLQAGVAKGYPAYNWLRGMPYSELIGSCKRHLTAFERGEDHDPESKLLHLQHLAVDALMLAWYVVMDTGEDDRRFKCHA